MPLGKTCRIQVSFIRIPGPRTLIVEDYQVDASLERKNKIASDKLTTIDTFPVFSIVEINLLAACNRSCSFCPVSDKNFYKIINSKGRMNVEFFDKIVSDLREFKFKGKILFSGNSEPLLHKKLELFIEHAVDQSPGSQIEIVTNGDILTVKRLKSLFASGLSYASVSLYDGPEQFEEFTNVIEEAEVDPTRVILKRRFLEEGNYGIYFSNRGGMIDVDEFREEIKSEEVQKFPLQKVCYYPFYMIKVDFNGDVMLCSHDWARRGVLGNVNDESLWSIWTGKKMEKIKKNLAGKNRNMLPCDTCDVQGDLIGKDSFDEWVIFRKAGAN